MDTNKQEEFIFKFLLLALACIPLFIVAACYLYYSFSVKVDKLNKRLDRIQSGVSTFVMEEPLTGKRQEYLAVGVANINDNRDETAPVLPVYVNETGYTKYLNELRVKLIEYRDSKEDKA